MSKKESETSAKRNDGPDGKTVLIVVLVGITVIALMFAAVAFAALTGRINLPALPRADTPRLTPVPTPTEEPLTDRIALPQFAQLNMAADTAEQSLTFDNPYYNFAYFRVSLVLEDETIWESELLAPGETSSPVLLKEPLPAGEYEVLLCYACFSDETEQNALNGARSPVRLIVG